MARAGTRGNLVDNKYLFKNRGYAEPSKLRIRNFWFNDFGNHHDASIVSKHMSAVRLAGFLAGEGRIIRGYALPHELIRNAKVFGGHPAGS